MNDNDTAVDRGLHRLTQKLYENRDLRFWFCQIIGWAGYSIVTFLSITLVDDHVSWTHEGHIMLSAGLVVLTTWSLRPLFRQTFNLSVAPRVAIASAAVLLSSGVWTVLRIVVFAWIVGETAIWDEFNYWYFGSLFVFLSWTVLYYGIKYYELHALEHQKLIEEHAQREGEHLKRVQAQAAARDAHLQKMRYQLNPHFLFNTLNAINALIALNENDKAREMLQLLSEFLRHSLEHDGIENVSLEQELESLMLYLNIEKTRFEDRLTLEFDVSARARQAKVPGLILQPIVENSMKYAIAENEDGGTVRVKAGVSDNVLLLEVSDTGPGMKTAQATEGRGVGLQNTLQRLQTLYGDNYSFETLNTEPTGLAIQIRFPFDAESPNLGKTGAPS